MQCVQSRPRLCSHERIDLAADIAAPGQRSRLAGGAGAGEEIADETASRTGGAHKDREQRHGLFGAMEAAAHAVYLDHRFHDPRAVVMIGAGAD